MNWFKACSVCVFHRIQFAWWYKWLGLCEEHKTCTWAYVQIELVFCHAGCTGMPICGNVNIVEHQPFISLTPICFASLYCCDLTYAQNSSRKQSRVTHSFFTQLGKHCLGLEEESDKAKKSVDISLLLSPKEGSFCDQFIVGPQEVSVCAEQSLVSLPSRAYDGPTGAAC